MLLVYQGMDKTFCENVNINWNKTKNVDVKVQLLALNNKVILSGLYCYILPVFLL